MLAVLHRGSVLEGLEFAACLTGHYDDNRTFHVDDVSAATIVDRSPGLVKVNCRAKNTGLWHSHIFGRDYNACMLSKGDVESLRKSGAPVSAITCNDANKIYLIYQTPGSTSDQFWRRTP